MRASRFTEERISVMLTLQGIVLNNKQFPGAGVRNGRSAPGGP
ncbi:hypothetical protein [Xanthobacter agilis]